MNVIPENFKFIDLFAGIGGFHYAMKKLSDKSECVFASEIDPNAIKLYNLNFRQNSGYDITRCNPNEIDDFHVLCAGFPCQPFSKAGFQNGFEDERGNLFFEITRIIKAKIEQNKKPPILILENVRNLASHDNKNTWNTIYNSLVDLGYNTRELPIILSPKDFGVPQLRERAIIIAVDKNIYNGKLDFSIKKQESKKDIYSLLQKNNAQLVEKFGISSYEVKVLDAWEFFYRNLDIKVIGFPIWSDYFFTSFPIDHLPSWKQNFITKNRVLYQNNKNMIDEWYKKYDIESLKKTHRKFEWQAGKSINSIYDGIIQFRPSGIRVKRPDYAPTLVAMAHVPIIGKYRRYITPIEASRLQSLPRTFKFDSVGNDIYRLLGNAVNVNVIYYVMKSFLDFLDEKVKVLEGNS